MERGNIQARDGERERDRVEENAGGGLEDSL